MIKTIMLFMLVMCTVAGSSQSQKADSLHRAKEDSIFVAILNSKYVSFGNALATKLIKADWELVMTELDIKLGEAIVEWRKRKKQ